MRPWRMVAAVGVALVLPLAAGCGGAKTGATKTPAPTPAAAAQKPDVAPRGPETAVEPPSSTEAPRPPTPTPQVTAGTEAPAPEPREPPRPVVHIETPPREKTPALPATYTWQAGDKLFLVARRFYGDGRLWPRIVEANQAIQALSEIPVGTVLVIPPK